MIRKKLAFFAEEALKRATDTLHSRPTLLSSCKRSRDMSNICSSFGSRRTQQIHFFPRFRFAVGHVKSKSRSEATEVSG